MAAKQPKNKPEILRKTEKLKHQMCQLKRTVEEFRAARSQCDNTKSSPLLPSVMQKIRFRIGLCINATHLQNKFQNSCNNIAFLELCQTTYQQTYLPFESKRGEEARRNPSLKKEHKTTPLQHTPAGNQSLGSSEVIFGISFSQQCCS